MELARCLWLPMGQQSCGIASLLRAGIQVQSPFCHALLPKCSIPKPFPSSFETACCRDCQNVFGEGSKHEMENPERKRNGWAGRRTRDACQRLRVRSVEAMLLDHEKLAEEACFLGGF